MYIPRIRRAVERFGTHFLARVYTSTEQQGYKIAQQSASPKDPAIAYLAGRWAAKEAVVKALGTGWTGLNYTDVEIDRQQNGVPRIVLYGTAATRLQERGVPQWKLSISHDQDYAIASALLIVHPHLQS